MCLTTVKKYVAEGRSYHQQRMAEVNGPDPIYEFWVFSRLTKLDSMDTTFSILNRQN